MAGCCSIACVHVRLSIRPSVGELLGRGRRLTMMSHAAVSARGQVSVNIRFHVSWVKFPRLTSEEGPFSPSQQQHEELEISKIVSPR